GEKGMLDGFHTVLRNGGDILVSQESATYRPEMEWLVGRLQENTGSADPGYKVIPAETYQPHPGRDVYRFFELFDLPNISNIDAVMKAAAAGTIRITPP